MQRGWKGKGGTGQGRETEDRGEWRGGKRGGSCGRDWFNLHGKRRHQFWIWILQNVLN